MKNKNIDLLNGPIFSSLTKLAIPITATALVQMTYNLTDMAWIGRVGSAAVTAVGSGSMYTWLSQGFMMIAKMGSQIKVSHALGQQDEEEAVRYAQGGLQLGILFAVLFSLVSIFCSGPMIRFFGLQDQTTIYNAEIYLKITCGGIIFSFLNAILTGILIAMGNSQISFRANVVGLIINMVLDPILIFGIGPVPALGVMGAAIATVLAQCVVAVIILGSIRHYSLVFPHIRLLSVTPWENIRTILHVGFPLGLQNILFTSISMILTRIVAGFGDSAVAVQRLGSQIESISWMTVDGFAAAINSYVGQNFGAKQFKRIRRGYLVAVLIILVWGTFTSCLLIFGGKYIFEIFIQEQDIVPMGIDYLTILGFSQLFMCVEMISSAAMSGLGKTGVSSAISITLTSIRIPMSFFLSMTVLGLNGVWWALTISSIAKRNRVLCGILDCAPHSGDEKSCGMMPQLFLSELCF